MAKVTAASKGPMDQYLHTEQVGIEFFVTVLVPRTPWII